MGSFINTPCIKPDRATNPKQHTVNILNSALKISRGIYKTRRSGIYYFEIQNFARGVFSLAAAAKYIISKFEISLTGEIPVLNDITITYICYKNVIYDIGTKILNFQCFCIMENHIFSKSIIFSGIGSIFRALSYGTIKTRFKAFWDIFLKICMRTWIRRLRFFIKFCPQRATEYKIECFFFPRRATKYKI